jgi:hypothetical protein
MALFKPMKGNSSALPSTMTDGWAYFCTDTGEFFIDYADSNGELHRKQINAEEAKKLTGYDIVTALNNSNNTIPTSAGVKTYVDTNFAAKTHGHDFSELTVNDTEAAKVTLDIEDGMVLKDIALEAPFYIYTNPFVAYADGKFVAIKGQSGNYTDIAYSTDGITWTVVTMPVSAQWRSVSYGNGVFVVISYSSNIAAYSTDGIIWTQTTMPVESTWCSVAYGDGKFVAVSGDNSSKNIAAYSTDGITWTQATMPNSANWQSVTYGNGKFVAFTTDINAMSIVAYSTDGIIWSRVSDYVTVAYAKSIIYGNDKFVIVGKNKFAYSIDGITWTVSEFPISAAAQYVIYACGKFVVGCSDKILYSPDGINWTQSTCPVQESIKTIAYGNGKFVAMVIDSRIIIYSYDGINWKDSIQYISQNDTDVTADTLSVLKHTHTEYLTEQVQADLSQTDSAQVDYVKGVIRQESLPEGYPYEEDVIYLETSVSESYTKIDASWLELGKTYIVQYGDTSYELTAETGKSINLWGSSYIYIGCDMSSRGAYGDYPFSIYRIDESTPDSGGQMFVFKETPTEPVYIKVSNPDTIIHTIDPKYLPEGYPYEEVTATDISGQEYEITRFTETSLSVTHNLNIPFELGQVWSAGLETLSYECEVQAADDGTLYIGSIGASSTPFYITANEGEVLQAYMNNHRNASAFYLQCVSGTVSETTIHPMDEKFLPSSATAQSDWSISDENDPAYVKNRTHYDDTTYIIRTQEDINQLVNTAIDGTSLDDAELIEGLTFRVVVDGVVYDNVPIYYNCYIAGGNTWAIGDSYYGRSNSWLTTDYGFCYHGHGGWAHNSDIFPNGIENIEVYTVEHNFKHLDHKYIKDMYYEEIRSINRKETSTDINNGANFSRDNLAELLKKYKETSLIYIGSDTVPYVYLEGTDTTGTDLVDGDYQGYTVQYKNSLGTDTAKENVYIYTDGSIQVGTSNNFPSVTIEIIGEETIIHQIDSKYIKDMYHEESSEVFSIENAEFDDGRYINETPFIITDGNTYVVNWDGTEYICVAYTFEGTPTIGNTSSFGGIGNGEPFAIGYDSEANENFIVALNDSTDGSTTTHTVSVIENVVHTIDHKYIKDMYYDNGSTTTLLVDNQTVTGFEVMEDPIYAVMNPFSFSTVVGATYTVTWDGTDYECTASTMFGMTYIGNINYVNMQSGGDIPFAIVFSAGDTFLVTESTEESHTISITEVIHDMKQLDEKYLPILEEVNKTVFSMDTVVHDNEYDLPEGMLTGHCKVTVDGVSEDVIFVVDFDYSFVNTNSYHIETWDYGIYFGFFDGGTHSVKIEKVHNVVKEEYLPESVITTPNWNAVEGENGYIENRTHYEDGNCVLKFTAVNNNGSSYYYSYVSDYETLQPYIDLVNSGATTVYVKMNDVIVETTPGYYDIAFSLYYGEGFTTGNRLVFNYQGGTHGTTLIVDPKLVDPEYSADTVDICILTTSYYELKQIDEKFLPDSVKGTPDWNQGDETSPDYIKNRTHYEINDITKLEFDITGISFSNNNQTHNLNIPFALGQTWNVSFDNRPEGNDLEVMEDEDGSLYIALLGVSGDGTWECYRITANECTVDKNFIRANYVDALHITGVSGEVSAVHKLDEKFLPVATDDEILEMLMEQDMLLAVTDSDGSILSDENDNILLW